MFGRKSARYPIDTLIGKGMQIRGELAITGGIRVDGIIYGKLDGGDKNSMLLLGESGRIEGVVRVSHAVINGTIRGILLVDGAVELHAKARIEGDLYYRSMDMARGAIVTGKLIHWQDDVSLEQLFALTKRDFSEIIKKLELIGKEYERISLPSENHSGSHPESPLPS